MGASRTLLSAVIISATPATRRISSSPPPGHPRANVGNSLRIRYNLEFRPLLLHVQTPIGRLRATLSGEWCRGGIPCQITLLIEAAGSVAKKPRADLVG